MSGDYISREAARPDAFCEGVSCQDCPFCKNPIQGGCRIDDFVKSIPAADVVEVRHGQFIGTEYDGYADGNPVYYEWICSQCGCVFEDDEPKMNYCPNCGARMDGGQDE